MLALEKQKEIDLFRKQTMSERSAAIMLFQAERIVANLTDPRMKPLLKTILADERRHHKALAAILKTIVVEEKVSEVDWWDYRNKWAVFST